MSEFYGPEAFLTIGAKQTGYDVMDMLMSILPLLGVTVEEDTDAEQADVRVYKLVGSDDSDMFDAMFADGDSDEYPGEQ